MDKVMKLIEIPVKPNLTPVFILEGSLKEYSTKDLHYHSCHQFLRISTGITLLVEEKEKQPLFSNMTAFIPAGLPHRSSVMGTIVNYKSIYLDESLFNPAINEIVIFDMSELGVALFNRINPSQNKTDGISLQCLNLLLELMKKEIHFKSSLTHIPVPGNPENKKITEYIENNFNQKLTLSEFTNVLHYSDRHISRIFKEDLKVSIFEYLKLCRIFQSALKLCEDNSSETITSIAFSCGYDSLSSFYKDFREIFSMTPKMFKQKNRRTIKSF